MLRSTLVAAVGLALLGGPTIAAGDVDLKTVLAANPAAYIPPSCYTRTVDAAGRVHNPCYTCHVDGREPTYTNDADLQLRYDFPGPASVNPWTNLFVDRRPGIAAQSDASILRYARSDNYHDQEGRVTLVRQLADLPRAWDVDGNGTWSGYVPDIWFHFDDAGFDRAPDGRATGWRAYAYTPLPGGFWPTNGSFDDVAIRLPPAFRENPEGRPDQATYEANLAIVEALIKQADVPITPLDEAALGVDLDRDGRLGTATRVVFAFDPRHGVTMHYAGQAAREQAAGRVHLAAGLFPEGTELVHSLRYLDVGSNGDVVPAPRMKELRYAVKRGWRTYYDLQEQALAEIKEAHDYPDRLRRVFGDAERGLGNGQGWVYQGFIEDAGGALRPQSFEESLTCVGCHGGIGRTTDSTFSYAAKRDAPAFRGGWYHWSQAPRGRIPDPGGEYATYLRRNAAGDEFRANDEVKVRFIGLDGQPKPAALAGLATSIAGLVVPSPARALALDKAYRLIVGEQSYAKGRTPLLEPVGATVHHAVVPGQATGIAEPAD